GEARTVPSADQGRPVRGRRCPATVTGELPHLPPAAVIGNDQRRNGNSHWFRPGRRWGGRDPGARRPDCRRGPTLRRRVDVGTYFFSGDAAGPRGALSTERTR